MKKIVACLLSILCIMTVPAFAEGADITIDVTLPAAKYDGTERAKDFYLYGGGSHYSWVEYEVTAPEAGLYRLDAMVTVSANHTAQLKIAANGVDVSGIYDIAASATAWELRSAMLHDAIPLNEGTNIIRITQAELVSHVTLNALHMTKVGEFVAPLQIDVTTPIECFDGVGRAKDFHFYGGKTNNHSWAKYEVEISQSGMYRPDIQVTVAPNEATGMRLEIDGVMTNDILDIPANPGNYVLQSFSMEEIALTEGTHIIRVYQTVGTATSTLNYFALTRTQEYNRPESVTLLGSTAVSSTVENLSSAGDGYKERAQVRGGQTLSFDLSMPTGMYDVALLVSASEEYPGFVTTSFNGNVMQEEMPVPAEYETDALAKDGVYYEVPVAENVWFHTGDNELIVTGGGSNTKLFYLRGVVIKPSEKRWIVRPALSAFDEESGVITAGIYAENHYTEQTMDMVFAVAFYDADGMLVELWENPVALENGVPYEMTSAIDFPEHATLAKAFVWEGTSVYESSMMYYTESLEQTR